MGLASACGGGHANAPHSRVPIIPHTYTVNARGTLATPRAVGYHSNCYPWEIPRLRLGMTRVGCSLSPRAQRLTSVHRLSSLRAFRSGFFNPAPPPAGSPRKRGEPNSERFPLLVGGTYGGGSQDKPPPSCRFPLRVGGTLRRGFGKVKQRLGQFGQCPVPLSEVQRGASTAVCHRFLVCGSVGQVSRCANNTVIPSGASNLIHSSRQQLGLGILFCALGRNARK